MPRKEGHLLVDGFLKSMVKLIIQLWITTKSLQRQLQSLMAVIVENEV
jgi:hypothetical protein